ncbi:MAG: hypothetical protein AAF402_11210 [Pseudomonadota bacterium]
MSAVTAVSAQDSNVTKNHQQELERIQVLVRANVLDLAETLLEEGGPEMEPSKLWRRWQRQLWKLYSVRGKWQELYDSAAAVPRDFPQSIRKEALLHSLDALLALERAKDTRILSREYLLSTELDEVFKQEIRKRVVESYLVEGLEQDARIAMRQFQQDYRSQDPDWLVLSARVQLQSGNADEAVNTLAPLTEPESRILQLFARLKNGSIKPEAAIDRALEIRNSASENGFPAAILAVLIEAYRKAGKLYPVVEVLEEYIQLPEVRSYRFKYILPEFAVTDLMEAYTAVAIDQGNRFGMLVGEELSWLTHANSVKSSATITRRSLFAYIASQSSRSAISQLSRDSLINILLDIERPGIIERLFGEQSPLGPLRVSGSTGLRLSNYALEQGLIQLAADANESLLQLPPGMDRREWLLHSARLSIIAGRYEAGAESLMEWITSFDALEPDQTDQVLQPVFDLQTVGQHEIALPLLIEIDSKSPGKRHRRELSYWIAESLIGTDQYLRAADYFLFSAMLENDGFDQWGESARFNAADALLEAGMIDDAKTLFEDLLRRAQEDNRKIALQQKLQQLWLRESEANTLDSESSN